MDIDINKKEIVRIDGVYKSMLFANWFAAQIIVYRDGTFFRIRCPYNSEEKAWQAIDFFENKRLKRPQTDYRPLINICDKNGYVR